MISQAHMMSVEKILFDPSTFAILFFRKVEWQKMKNPISSRALFHIAETYNDRKQYRNNNLKKQDSINWIYLLCGSWNTIGILPCFQRFPAKSH
jgi:hypothetical protein